MPTLPIGIDLGPPVAALSGGFGVQTGGPWSFNGALYVGVTSAAFDLISVYKSTDGGNTWTGPLDSANQPPTYGTFNFDGDHTATAAYCSGGDGNQSPIWLQSFDLATETWGAVFGDGGDAPAGITAAFIAFRPDSSIVLLYQNNIGPGLNQEPFFAAFAAGSWSSPLQLDTNAVGTCYLIGLLSAVIEDTGAVHTFTPVSTDNGNSWSMFYQEITPLNAAGAFEQFPTINNGNLSMGAPAPSLVDGKIFVPYFASDAGAVGYVSGIRSSWSGVVGPIDPGLSGDATLLVFTGTAGIATLVGGTLTFIYTAQGSDTDWVQARIRLLETTSLADPSTGWTGQTIADAETFPADLLPIGAPKSQRILGLGPYLPNVGMTFNMFQPESASFNFSSFFLPFEVGPTGPTIDCGNPPAGSTGTPYSHALPVTGGTPPYTFAIIAGGLPPGTSLNPSTGVISGVPTTPGTFGFTAQVTDADALTSEVTCSIVISGPGPQTIPGGGPPAILCPRPINIYDLCAEAAVRRTRKIEFPPSCNIPTNFLPWDEEGIPTPAGARPFYVQGRIVTPDTAAGDVLVCQDRVPLGYDALLTDIYQTYQGSGFQNGSGDIVFRIRRNQVWLKTLGNSPYAIGNSRQTVGLTLAEIIFSGSTFSYFVNVPNLSGMIQIGNSGISCGMRGFYWPRG